MACSEALKGEGEREQCVCGKDTFDPQKWGACYNCRQKGEGEKSPRRRLILGVADQLADDAEDLERP